MERIPNSPDDQADLPAQKAPPRQGTRLPRPDEDDAGTSRARRSARSRSQTARGLTDRRGTQGPRLVMLSRPREFAAFEGRDHQVQSAPHRPVSADRSGDNPFRVGDRAQARQRRRPEPGSAPAPRGAQGDGALVPARLGRPHHRPARHRRGRPRRTGRGIAPDACPGRRTRRAFGHVKHIGIGLIKLYRIVFAWLPSELSVRADVLPLHRAGHREIRPPARQLDGRQADRTLPSVESGRL